MRTSKQGLMALISHEGIVTSPYKDSVGVWTIGVGHTASAGDPDPAKYKGEMTVAEVFDLFKRDVAKYEADVNRAVKVPLKQYEFDALVSFHYNTGGIGRANLVKSLNAGDRHAASQQFLNWLKPPEIANRRRAEMKLFRDGIYPAPFANIYPAENSKVQWSKAQRVYLPDMLADPKPTPAPDSRPPETPKPSLLSLILSIFTKLFRRSK